MSSCQLNGGHSSRTGRLVTVILTVCVIVLGYFYDQYLYITPDSEHLGLFTNREQVESVKDKLRQESNLVRQADPFKIKLLNSAEIPAAFVLASGQIYITGGLLDYLETEEQVAAVLAHEMAHVISNHFQTSPDLNPAQAGFFTQLDQADENQVLSNMINGPDFNHQDELEADLVGMCILAQAGFDPLVMVELLDILEKAAHDRQEFLEGSAVEYHSQQSPQESIRTHPSHETRRVHLLENISQIEGCYP